MATKPYSSISARHHDARLRELSGSRSAEERRAAAINALGAASCLRELDQTQRQYLDEWIASVVQPVDGTQAPHIQT